MTIKEERSIRKKRKILQVARLLFVQDGYPGTGMERVARDANVSTATLYTYFPGKAELFKAVIDDALSAIVPPQATQPKGAAREELTRFALGYGRFLSDPAHRALYRLVAAERRRFSELAQELGRRARHDLGGALIRLIRALHKAGDLKVDNPVAAAGQLLGMIEHSTLVVAMIEGDDTQPGRPLDIICNDAVETFLARYAAR